MGTRVDEKDKLTLAFNAELLQVIISQGGKKYDPKIVVKRVLQTVLINEPLSGEVRTALTSCLNS